MTRIITGRIDLNDSVRVRLQKKHRVVYEREALKQGISLSEYLRQLLDTNSLVLDKIDTLKHNSGSEAHRQFKDRNIKLSGTHEGILVEMLMLLRHLVQPQQMRMIQSELKRLGLEVWGISSLNKDTNDESG